MAKNVALSNDTYGMLERLKRGDESFSDVIKRLANEKESKPNWRDFVGVWKDDEEIAKIFDKILEDRHKVYRRQFKW
ncbi:MAG TPA: antitoxin VapB family protein [archaeon]|nr:antitoxin VapB family protein [archaeon]